LEKEHRQRTKCPWTGRPASESKSQELRAGWPIRDDYSRYILCTRALASARSEVGREEFQRVFEHKRLPEVIRSDNGVAFAANCSPSAELVEFRFLISWWNHRTSMPSKSSGERRGRLT